MIADLSALLAPAGVDDLLAAMRARRRLFAPAPDRSRFDDLLPWTTINTLFAVNRFAPGGVRVLQAANEVPAAMYRDPADLSRLRLDALQALAAQGVSILITGIDALVPAIDAAASMLERETRSRRSVNAYLSFRKQSAFLPHWDMHDVVVLHLHGRKHWRSYGMRGSFPAGGGSLGRGDDPGPIEWEQVLEPGDVLYIPRGEVHAAAVEPGDISVHVSVGLRRPRGSDVMHWLANGADEALRVDLFPVPAGDIASHEASVRASLHRIVDGLDLEAFLSHLDRERPHRVAPNFGATATNAETVLHCALPRRVPLRTSQSGRATITVDGAAIELGEAAGAVLRLLMEHDSMTLARIQTALARPFDDVRAAAMELAQNGLVHVNAGSGHGQRPPERIS